MGLGIHLGVARIFTRKRRAPRGPLAIAADVRRVPATDASEEQAQRDGANHRGHANPPRNDTRPPSLRKPSATPTSPPNITAAKTERIMAFPPGARLQKGAREAPLVACARR